MCSSGMLSRLLEKSSSTFENETTGKDEGTGDIAPRAIRKCKQPGHDYDLQKALRDGLNGRECCRWWSTFSLHSRLSGVWSALVTCSTDCRARHRDSPLNRTSVLFFSCPSFSSSSLHLPLVLLQPRARLRCANCLGNSDCGQLSESIITRESDFTHSVCQW